MEKHFDYIISGAGCAGMSVLMRMMQDAHFNDKKILIVDAALKNTNDRTWCFWEQQPGVFESVVHHRWNQLVFHSADGTVQSALEPYQYKMIRGIDLYNHVKELAAAKYNITWKTAKVLGISHANGLARVQVENEIFTAPSVINSILFSDTPQLATDSGSYHLLQHFKGWMIETSADCFDPNIATFMDFRVSQQAGTTFVYVLPVSKRKALVEYTLFSANLLPQAEYEAALQNYIEQFITKAEYTVEHTEWGVIPMTNHPFKQEEGPVQYIGTAGGQVKASSGFAFQFIQKRADEMIALLKSGTNRSFLEKVAEKKFRLYDSVLLQVLNNQLLPGDVIFSSLFKKNPVQRIFRFLDNKSTLADDFHIMTSVPTRIFLPAALREMNK
ncbi:MAG: lycopene cyclase [Sediminibacterium sp.]|nr:lycopene cyclase [Sediminibacterium sp.]